MRAFRSVFIPALALIGCTAATDAGNAGQQTAGQSVAGEAGRPFQVREIAQFREPWAMAFLPGGRQALITEKRGAVRLWTVGGQAVDVAGVPQVAYGGQGGLGDVAVHPDFANNGVIYLSYAEAGENGTRHAAVGRGRLVTEGGSPRIENFQVIWRQEPGFDGRGHYGHRLLFSPDGQFLFISSGERQEFDPAQDRNSNAGKIVRLTDTGMVPSDNPFYDQGRIISQVWSLGHRNPLGMAWDADGRLWEIEMGPQGGDELNLVERGANYGYPIVSNGDHYDGRPIPDHDTRPEFAAPKVTWTPVISPGNMIYYTGSMFPEWRGDLLVAGLSSQALVRVDLDGTSAREAERWNMGQRIREVEQGPDGSIYLLEDERNGSGGRLLHLTPAR
ncbi:PQQ-dependent sugar dehydrogenase [Sphingosinicella sp. LHD-64]|uniref:PQQ-dependent sugar dehydrogenase n=1 Tax=Sphingosinicella sp. LHD-64 TaxID=3072139 RepID=UPI00280D127E|nr:PQQ-dependent sugar dehydrogenase [Sphingosinicella sp. LHD-64]MDQ8756021.1 PQQ-dependent sugar dehydrogenase [Sphingosinicella sp. LHD-64]